MKKLSVDGAADAEWYYLNGLISSKRGRVSEARKFFTAAAKKDPENIEYSRAYRKQIMV